MNLGFKGHLIIKDELGTILLDKDNSIHFENLSLAIAESLTAGPLNSSNPGFIYSMNFGNGGTTVNSSGIIIYNPPNIYGTNAQLYNQTYSKVVNNNFTADIDIVNNNITYSHISGNNYSDITVNCQLSYAEPADQLSFDNSNYIKSTYAFDELGLFSYDGQLLTHVIFSPIIKSKNRLFSISYSLRISALSGISA